MPHDPSESEIQEIAGALRTNRSRAHVCVLAKRFNVTESFVELIAESVVSRSFIFESAPVATKGTTAMTTAQTAEGITAIFKEHGTTPAAVSAVAKVYGITESAATHAAALFDAGTDRDGASAPVELAGSSRRHYLAAQLKEAVLGAESKAPERWSTQDIEALAAARFGA